MALSKHLSSFNVTRKRGTLYLAIIGLWVFALAISAPSFWHTFISLNSIIAKAIFVPLAGCLALFWFYGVYHLVFLIFSYLPRPDLRTRAEALAKEMPPPRTAIIYTTYNDFNRDAALTCLKQDYPNSHLFILDVSTNPDMRKQADAFHEEFAATTLIRLQPRQGFKARSLNDALKTAIGADFEFFAVCDADNYLPVDFLSRTIPYFFLDKQIAFVQANHNSTKLNQNKFVRDFEVAIDASWYLHQLPRGRYGLLMCMVHGAWCHCASGSLGEGRWLSGNSSGRYSLHHEFERTRLFWHLCGGCGQ
jgi:cellulose synthase/poly-beta-1,6-N-acetylglucosamine synthase-like glycosyltransferase